MVKVAEVALIRRAGAAAAAPSPRGRWVTSRGQLLRHAMRGGKGGARRELRAARHA